MLTRYLAYICFITASCWLLFAGGLLFAAIRQEPQHFWLSTGLMLTVLLPTGCTALYVYRTGFGRPAGEATQTPFSSESEQKLHALQQAQRAFLRTLTLTGTLPRGSCVGLAPAQLAPVMLPMTCPLPIFTYSTTGSGSGRRCTQHRWPPMKYRLSETAGPRGRLATSSASGC